VVAILTALTIIVLWVYEPVVNGLAARVLSVYAYFAFMLTWMREIVKDMEDFKGDAEEGCITMPIKWGLKRSTLFISGLGLLAVVPLAFVAYVLYNYHYYLLSLFIALFLILPLAVWSAYLKKGMTSLHYHKASSRLKIIMVLGIISLIVYYFQIF
jgi:4-hydroxybenzoate polyprenyltransferase